MCVIIYHGEMISCKAAGRSGAVLWERVHNDWTSWIQRKETGILKKGIENSNQQPSALNHRNKRCNDHEWGSNLFLTQESAYKEGVKLG